MDRGKRDVVSGHAVEAFRSSRTISLLVRKLFTLTGDEEIEEAAGRASHLSGLSMERNTLITGLIPSAVSFVLMSGNLIVLNSKTVIS
jgi:hypothetical protein